MEYEAYTDGSYNEVHRILGAGVVILDAKTKNIITTKSLSNVAAEYVQMRNVAAEILAAYLGICYVLDVKANDPNRSLVLYHDYVGIGNWPDGKMKTRNAVTEAYRQCVEAARKEFDIRFEWVRGHSGNQFNEMADRLAKKAIKDAIDKARSEIF